MRYAFLEICSASTHKEVVKRARADREGKKRPHTEVFFILGCPTPALLL
jgi:hypothetical protein